MFSRCSLTSPQLLTCLLVSLWDWMFFYVALAMCPGVWPQQHPKTAGSLHCQWLSQNYQKACLNLSVVAIQFERLSCFFELQFKKKNASKWATKLKKKVSEQSSSRSYIVQCCSRSKNIYFAFPSGFLTRQQRFTCNDKISDYCQDEFSWEVPQVPTTSAPFTTTLNGSQRSTYEKAPTRHIQVRLISVNTT